jgi:enediyne biosynthesis protein E5
LSASRLRRFARTPKGLTTVILAGLAFVAAFPEGWSVVGPELAGAILAAIAVDAPILRWKKGKWEFPDGALLTGLIVGMILSPHEPWYVGALTAIAGIAGKYLVRIHKANVFNPAALGLVATFYVFDTGQSWWGALTGLPLMAVAVLIVVGVFMADRVKKMPAVLAFLGSYYLLVTIAAYVGDPRHVAELYREPDLHAALFFAFFMVSDPPTSPPKPREQVIFGVMTGVVSYAVFALVGAAYFLLAGLLVANAWESWRRRRVGARQQAARHAASAAGSGGPGTGFILQ